MCLIHAQGHLNTCTLWPRTSAEMGSSPSRTSAGLASTKRAITACAQSVTKVWSSRHSASLRWYSCSAHQLDAMHDEAAAKHISIIEVNDLVRAGTVHIAGVRIARESPCRAQCQSHLRCAPRPARRRTRHRQAARCWARQQMHPATRRRRHRRRCPTLPPSA